MEAINLKDVGQKAEPAEAPESSTETTEPEKTPAEAPQEQQEESEETVETEQPAKVEVVEEKPLSNKTQERMRNLANENKQLKAEREAFMNQPAPNLDGEMTVDDLNKMVNERAMSAADLIIRGQQTESDFKQQVNKWAEDFEQVKKDNTALDPKSPDYDAELDQTLARLLDSGDGTPRTDILVSNILKTLNKRESNAQSKAKEEGKSEATAKLAKQIAEGAVTPGSKAPSSDEGYSDEELSEMRVKNPKEYLRKQLKGEI
jgi:hypothetical protein